MVPGETRATRRDVIKGTLKGAAYAAPIVLATAVPMAVGAQVTRPATATAVPPTATTVPSGPTLLLNGSAANGQTFANGSTATVTGTGYIPGAIVYNVRPAGNGIAGGASGPQTVSASGVFMRVPPVVFNLPAGTYSFVTTYTNPVAPIGTVIVGELARITFNITGTPAATAAGTAGSDFTRG